MEIKLSINTLLCFMSLFSLQAQENIELNKAILKTITALNKVDEKVLNEMISEEYGLAILFKRGVNDNVLIEKSISIAHPIPEYLPYSFFGEINVNQKVKYENLPTFDCDTEKFTKENGIYCDAASNYNDVSQIALNENKYLYASWTEEQIAKMKAVEQKSKKIIAFGPNGTHIFYLTFIHNKWYLTMIDRFEVCSA